MDPINKTACENCRRDLDRQLEVNEKRLNAHSEKLEKLIVICEKLIQYQELEKSRSEESHEMIKVLVENAIKPAEPDKDSRPKFYEMKWFDWLVKGGVVIAILLVVAAIGNNIPAEFWTNLFN